MARRRSTTKSTTDELESSTPVTTTPKSGLSLDKSTQLITVCSAGDSNRVVIWERDSRHPNGEIFIKADQKPVQVFKTPGVFRKLAAGLLIEK